MTDSHILALALAVCAAAFVPVGSSMVLVVVAAGVALVSWFRRWPVVLVIAASLMASFGAGAAWAADTEVVSRAYSGETTLLSDPAPVPGGIRVLAEIDGERYDLRAWGSPAGWLRNRLMGERVEIEASLRPLRDAPVWLLAQGLAGRGTVTGVGGFDVGSPHTRLANSIRRTIESGADSLDRGERALLAGLVYGDDRQQSPLTADNFEAAGLTHLLAVSGQNVAFVLAIVGPVLRRLGHRQRFVFVVLVLLLFATVTRFEPSVMRASVMTGVAAVAALVGTEVSGRRILALAITGLVLFDPLIVHSVAFQLSVAASAGILFWSARVARALAGPRVVVESLAVTASAQLAVAPLLVWRFDGLPVASLPANLLAGPAAGPVMMWGLTGGLVAGLVPAGVAAVMHLPTRAALWWIDSVAALAPELPLGRLGAAHIVLLFLAGAIGLGMTSRAGRMTALVAILVVLVSPAVGLATTPPHSQAIDRESMIWRDDLMTIVAVDASSRPEQVLFALRAANIGDIDLVILNRSTFANAALIGWVRAHHHIAHIWAPAPTMGVGEVVPPDNAELTIDALTLTVTRDEEELVVTARPAD